MLRCASSSAEQAGEEKGEVLEALSAGVSHVYTCCQLWMHKAGDALCCWVRNTKRYLCICRYCSSETSSPPRMD